MGRIYSIPCHASHCALGRFEEYDELHHDDLKKKMNSSYSSKSSWYKIAGAAINGINFVPQTEATTFALASAFILLLWLGYCSLFSSQRGRRRLYIIVLLCSFVIVATQALNHGISTEMFGENKCHQFYTNLHLRPTFFFDQLEGRKKYMTFLE